MGAVITQAIATCAAGMAKKSFNRMRKGSHQPEAQVSPGTTTNCSRAPAVDQSCGWSTCTLTPTQRWTSSMPFIMDSPPSLHQKDPTNCSCTRWAFRGHRIRRVGLGPRRPLENGPKGQKQASNQVGPHYL